MNSPICRKAQKQLFLLVSGGHICAPQRDTNIASPFPNISHIKYRTDLLLGEDFCILSSFIPQFWTFCIKWFAFLFLIT